MKAVLLRQKVVEWPLPSQELGSLCAGSHQRAKVTCNLLGARPPAPALHLSPTADVL